MARLGLRVLRRHHRERARLVGDHADQPAGLKTPAQFHARVLGMVRDLPRGGGGSVQYRVGGQLGGDDDGVLGQWFQLPVVQRGHCELAGGSGRLRHWGKAETAPPRTRRCWFRKRWLPGGVAVICGLRRGRGTSLVHGSTTEPEFWALARQRSALQLRCHLGCADASALARGRQIGYWSPAQRRPGKRTGSSRRRRKTLGWVGVRRRKR